MRQELATVQYVFVGREGFCGFCKDAFSLETGQRYRSCTDDAPGDVVLYGKDVLGLGVVGFRPDMNPCRSLGQFDIDAKTIAGPANAATEQVTRIEQASDLGRRKAPTLEWEARRFRDDEQIREVAERCDDVLGHPVTKEILAGIARQVLEGQHRHRWAPCKPCRGGEARDIDRLGRGAEPKRVPTYADMKRPGAKAGRD